MLAADTLEALGIKRGDYVIKVNNRKVLDGVLEHRHRPVGETDAARRLTVLRAVDKLDRLGPTASRMLLGQGPQGRERRFHAGRRTSMPRPSTRVVRFVGARIAGRRARRWPAI